MSSNGVRKVGSIGTKGCAALVVVETYGCGLGGGPVH